MTSDSLTSEEQDAVLEQAKEDYAVFLLKKLATVQPVFDALKELYLEMEMNDVFPPLWIEPINKHDRTNLSSSPRQLPYYPAEDSK